MEDRPRVVPLSNIPGGVAPANLPCITAPRVSRRPPAGRAVWGGLAGFRDQVIFSGRRALRSWPYIARASREVDAVGVAEAAKRQRCAAQRALRANSLSFGLASTGSVVGETKRCVMGLLARLRSPHHSMECGGMGASPARRRHYKIT
jgi:hypothetical protein